MKITLVLESKADGIEAIEMINRLFNLTAKSKNADEDDEEDTESLKTEALKKQQAAEKKKKLAPPKKKVVDEDEENEDEEDEDEENEDADEEEKPKKGKVVTFETLREFAHTKDPKKVAAILSKSGFKNFTGMKKATPGELKAVQTALLKLADVED